jgi:hypothetical protein
VRSPCHHFVESGFIPRWGQKGDVGSSLSQVVKEARHFMSELADARVKIGLLSMFGNVPIKTNLGKTFGISIYVLT